VNVSPPFSTSDHDCIGFSIVTRDNGKVSPSVKIRDFRNANYGEIETSLATISWPDVFNTCIEAFVPFKREKQVVRKKFPKSVLNEQRKN